MRRFLIYLICLLFACSCNNEKKQAELARQKAYSDSIAEVQKQIEQKRIDSLAEYAIGDIKFGMSSKEIKESNLLTDLKIDEKQSDDKLSCKIIGLGYVVFQLINDKLDQVHIELEEQSSYKYYDERCIPYTINAIDRMKEMLTRKYGEPLVINPIPEPSDFSSLPLHGRYWVYYWNNIGDKEITIHIGNYEHRYYYAICEIYRVIKQKEEDLSEKNSNISEWMKMVEDDERKKDSAIFEML